MKVLIIDSSIFLGWMLPDENDASVRVIHDDFLNRRIDLIAPSILLYEILNGIRSALLRRRIDTSIANAMADQSLNALPRLIDFFSLAKNAYQLTNTYDISVYDASYVALAQKENTPFYTGDRKLAEKMREVRQVLWVEEYTG